MMSWVGPDGRVYHSHDGLAPHLMNPFTLLATSAEELHQSSLGISMKELSLLVSVALVVLGRFLLFFSSSFSLVLHIAMLLMVLSQLFFF